MTDQEMYDHFRLEGVRILLEPLRFMAMPEDPAVRNALLEPMIRALWDGGESGGRNLFEVAAELREAAALIEGEPDILLRDIGGPPEALREIAEHVATWNPGSGRLTGVTPTSGELGFRFPKLMNMLGIFYGQDGLALEDDTLSPSESLMIAVDNYHPLCPWWLPRMTAESQEALTLFQTEDALQEFFGAERLVGTPGVPWLEWLPLIIDVFGEHMRAHHPPQWVHSTR